MYLLPAELGSEWFLGQWHGAHRIVSLAQRLLSSILGRSLQGLAAIPIFGSDPGLLFPQDPVNANNPSTLGAFLFQNSFTERLALDSVLCSVASLHRWGQAQERRKMCLGGHPA